MYDLILIVLGIRTAALAHARLNCLVLDARGSVWLHSRLLGVPSFLLTEHMLPALAPGSQVWLVLSVAGDCSMHGNNRETGCMPLIDVYARHSCVSVLNMQNPNHNANMWGNTYGNTACETMQDLYVRGCSAMISCPGCGTVSA